MNAIVTYNFAIIVTEYEPEHFSMLSTIIGKFSILLFPLDLWFKVGPSQKKRDIFRIYCSGSQIVEKSNLLFPTIRTQPPLCCVLSVLLMLTLTI